jgi:anti-anti-sigma regulatory factor
MDHRKYMTILKLDDAAIASRRAFFAVSDDDLARLASLRPLAEKVIDAIVEDFYALLLSHPDTKKFFADEATIRRVKRTQREYFMGLFAGRCDTAYVEDRLRVGAVHERIGLGPTWYLGAYRQYLELIRHHFDAEIAEQEAARDGFFSVQRLVFFDVALAIDTYIAANLEALGRHQAAVRELSTPVIRVHDRVLLLPLVGTVDSHRAQQIMESVLTHVVEAQARCACRRHTRRRSPAEDGGGGAIARRTGGPHRHHRPGRPHDGAARPRRLVDAYGQPPERRHRARARHDRQVDHRKERMSVHGQIPILRIGSTLLVSIQIDLRDAVAEAFQADVLTAIEERGTTGLVVDISGLDMVDTYVARILAETGRMAKLMGTSTVLVGMRPEVAATLVRMGYGLEGVRTALDLDDGLALLGHVIPSR